LSFSCSLFGWKQLMMCTQAAGVYPLGGGLRSGEAGGGGSLGAMTHREYLAQADRLIAECKDRIARQREIIASAYENGHPTVLPVSLLRVLEENLRSFEKYRLLILDQIKKAQAQQQ